MDIFEEYKRHLESFSDAENEEFYAQYIRYLKDLPDSERRQYYKIVVAEQGGDCVMLILWEPGGCTMPHSHRDSLVRIRVLLGELRQSHFSVGKKVYIEERVGEYLAGRELDEDSDVIHSMGNLSSTDWAVSLHFFSPKLEEVMVYDFGKNRKYVVRGDEDTHTVPKESEPIWEDD